MCVWCFLGWWGVRDEEAHECLYSFALVVAEETTNGYMDDRVSVGEVRMVLVELFDRNGNETLLLAVDGLQEVREGLAAVGLQSVSEGHAQQLQGDYLL